MIKLLLAAQLILLPLNLIASPSIDSQPTGIGIDAALLPGSNYTLSVSASGGSLSYQWETYLPPAGWQDLQGATNSSYTSTYNAMSDGGAFRVEVSNSTGSVMSDIVEVLVQDPGKSYTPINYASTWAAAKAAAESQGGYLLEINSYGEWLYTLRSLDNSFASMSDTEYFTFLDGTLAPDGGGSAYLWLGGSDAAVEGEWRWASSGEQFWSGGKNGIAVNGAFNRWGETMQQNEPDNFNGNQDALAMALETWPFGSDGTVNELGYAYAWNDVSANNQLYFIIEKDLSGPPVIESYGNTDLLEDSSGYYAGSADTPLLYSGTQVSPTYPSASFTAVGVDEVNGAYRLILSSGSQYYAANFSLSGSNSSAWAVVSDILVEEVNLQQDFDGDGHVGTPPIDPPASISGMQFEYISTDNVTSVPHQEFYGSDDLAAYGFSNSIIGRIPYTYSDGVISFPEWDEEIRLTFTSANSGTYEFFETDALGRYLDDSGTFSIVTTPSLEDKTDWQHTETFDGGFSTDYWNISHGLEDRVEVASGALNFIFAGAVEEGEEDEYDDYEIDLDYSRALPMDESWQIVMDDVYASNSLEGFEFELELEFEGGSSLFHCGFEFQNSWQGGSGNSIDAFYGSTIQASDINNDGVIQTASYAWDLDGDGFVDLGNEVDYDGDGRFDIHNETAINEQNINEATYQGYGPADVNGNGIIDAVAYNFDINGDGLIQVGVYAADLDNDGFVDLGNEVDYDGDGRFDIHNETNINENVPSYANGSASVSTTEDSRIQSNVSLRITHNANSRELVFEYQPNGVNEWSELARLNLVSGGFSGLNAQATTQGSAELSSSFWSLELYLEVEAEETTQAGDLKIGGIEIGSYTPPPPPASPESLVGYKLVGQFAEVLAGLLYRHDFFFTGSETMQGHYFVESNDPSSVDDWSEETYTYQKTGATTGTVAITNSTGETTDVELTFDSATTGTVVAYGRNGNQQWGVANGPFTFVPYDPSELPEPPLPVIESYGNTDLLEDSSGYYAGSADTPLLYSGTQVSPTYPSASFTVVGVDEVNGSYRLVLTNGIQYYAANFSLSGSNSSAWAVVSDILVEEVNLQQDFDGDGHVGTPPIDPPAEIEGMQFEYTSSTNATSVPSQELYGSDGFTESGFSNSIIERFPYTYSDGVISFPEWSEEIRLTFTDANSGTYAFVELYGGPMGGEVEDSGTFAVVTTPSLVEKTDWQHTETFDSGFSTDYWNIFHDTEDRVEVASGALNFIFAGAGEGVPEPDPTLDYDDYEIEIDYGRTLPMDESWQIVMDDVYASSSINDFEFDIELEFEGQGYNFECGFDFESSYLVEDSGSGIDVSFYSQTPSFYVDGNAVVSNIDDPRIQSNVSLRITHNANSRELVFEYQPGDAIEWSELARLNLGSGDFSGLNSTANSGNGELLSASQRMAVSLEVEVDEATQAGDLKIGGIVIGSYTPPPTPVDSDGDGLDDSVETNTGTYVSPTDTGTNPQLKDSSGDGFTDYEAVNASVDPNSDYGGLLNVVRQDPERFGIDNIGLDPGSIVDMQMGSVGLERGADGNFDMNFDIEMSTDLQTWTPHSSETIEISVPDQSKTFMRLNVK